MNLANLECLISVAALAAVLVLYALRERWNARVDRESAPREEREYPPLVPEGNKIEWQ